MKKTINGIGIVTVTVALLLNLAALGLLLFAIVDIGAQKLISNFFDFISYCINASYKLICNG
jgi:hypothetical protein